jgi:hypothetical protein
MQVREWPGGDAAADLDPAPGEVPAPLAPMTVVLRGWNAWRVIKFVAALLYAGYLMVTNAWGLPLALGGTAARIAVGFAGCGMLAGVLLLPWLRYRHELTIDANGITQWHSDARAHDNEWTRIGWNEIAEWSAWTNERVATFLVVAGDGRAVGLTQRTPGEGTLELIRRLTDEVDRHPRVPRIPDPPPRPVEHESAKKMGCADRMVLLFVSFVVLGLANGYLVAALGLKLAPVWVMAAAIAVPYLAYRLWMQLDDSDRAYADRGGRTFRRRTRNRLRRLFGLRHV